MMGPAASHAQGRVGRAAGSPRPDRAWWPRTVAWALGIAVAAVVAPACTGLRVGAVGDASGAWQTTRQPVPALPGVWRVSATADASVVEEAPHRRRALGASPTLWIGAGANGASFAYLTFALPAAPPSDVHVVTATLSLRVEDPLVARSIAVEARRVAAPWRERDIRWRSQPRVEREIAGEGRARAGDDVLDIDVSTSVAASHATGATSVSFVVTPANVDREHVVAFRSRESAVSVDALPLAPTLVLAYAPAFAEPGAASTSTTE